MYGYGCCYMGMGTRMPVSYACMHTIMCCIYEVYKVRMYVCTGYVYVYIGVYLMCCAKYTCCAHAWRSSCSQSARHSPQAYSHPRCTSPGGTRRLGTRGSDCASTSASIGTGRGGDGGGGSGNGEGARSVTGKGGGGGTCANSLNM